MPNNQLLIDRLPLPVAAITTLKKRGIPLLEDIPAFTKDEIEILRGVGRARR